MSNVWKHPFLAVQERMQEVADIAFDLVHGDEMFVRRWNEGIRAEVGSCMELLRSRRVYYTTDNWLVKPLVVASEFPLSKH